MVERSVLRENNIKLHLYYGREISVEGKQYKGTFYHGREISVEGKQYKVTFYHGREISVEGKQYKGTFLSWIVSIFCIICCILYTLI